MLWGMRLVEHMICSSCGWIINFISCRAKLAYHSAVDKFAEVAYQVLEVDRSIAPKEAALLGIERLENYFKELGMPTRFSDLGIGTDQFELMANKYSNNGQNAITTIITVDKAKALEIFNLAK